MIPTFVPFQPLISPKHSPSAKKDESHLKKTESENLSVEELLVIAKEAKRTPIETNTLIYTKVRTLLMSAIPFRQSKNSSELSLIPGIRKQLRKLRTLSEEDYPQIKKLVLKALRELLEEYPVTMETSVGVLDTAIELSEDLQAEKYQRLNKDFQKEIARTFCASVMLFLRHQKEGHVGGITKDQKDAFSKTLEKCKTLISDKEAKKNAALRFVQKVTMEAINRIKDDQKMSSEMLERIEYFAIAIKNAYDKDLAKSVGSLVKTFQGLDKHFTKQWFETYNALLQTLQKCTTESEKINIVHAFLGLKSKQLDWKIIYGSFEILECIVNETKEQASLIEVEAVIKTLEEYLKDPRLKVKKEELEKAIVAKRTQLEAERQEERKRKEDSEAEQKAATQMRDLEEWKKQVEAQLRRTVILVNNNNIIAPGTQKPPRKSSWWCCCHHDE